jgi:hypothetical protein
MRLDHRGKHGVDMALIRRTRMDGREILQPRDRSLGRALAIQGCQSCFVMWGKVMMRRFRMIIVRRWFHDEVIICVVYTELLVISP